MTDIKHIVPIRTRDAGRTKEAILRAAQKLFAERGYTTVGVREVAAEAGVNSTLVRRYFGSKEGLLREALEEVLSVDLLIEGDRREFGARTMETLEYAETIPNPVGIMLGAIADPAARTLCRDLIQDRIIEPLAQWLGGPDALARAARLNFIWVGYVAARQIFAVEPLQGKSGDSTLLWLAELTQRIADGENL